MITLFPILAPEIRYHLFARINFLYNRCFQCKLSILNCKIFRKKCLKRDLEVLQTENYQTLLKEIKDLNKWEDTSVHGLEDLTLLKWCVLCVLSCI